MAMTKPMPRRCVHCHAPVRLSNGQYFHADVPTYLGTIARETEIIPQPKIVAIITRDKT